MSRGNWCFWVRNFPLQLVIDIRPKAALQSRSYYILGPSLKSFTTTLACQ